MWYHGWTIKTGISRNKWLHFGKQKGNIKWLKSVFGTTTFGTFAAISPAIRRGMNLNKLWLFAWGRIFYIFNMRTQNSSVEVVVRWPRATRRLMKTHIFPIGNIFGEYTGHGRSCRSYTSKNIWTFLATCKLSFSCWKIATYALKKGTTSDS